jgi:hypothetical protein
MQSAVRFHGRQIGNALSDLILHIDFILVNKQQGHDGHRRVDRSETYLSKLPNRRLCVVSFNSLRHCYFQVCNESTDRLYRVAALGNSARGVLPM